MLSTKSRFKLHISWLLAAFISCGALLAVLAPAALAGSYVVTDTSDGDAGSLRAAITAANAAPGSTIKFQSGVAGTINLASPLPINAAMSIQGPGWATITLSGAESGGIVGFNTGNAVTISGFTLNGGENALRTGADVTITNCFFTGNSGGAVGCFGGNLTIQYCTFTNNSSPGSGGAVEQQGGAVNIADCTFIDNSCGGLGGAVSETGTSSYLDIVDCTFTGNKSVVCAVSNATILYSTFRANPTTAIFNSGTATIDYDILYGDGAGLGVEISSADSTRTYTVTTDVGACDIQGGGYPGSINADPLLAPLGNYGGPTQTMALLPGSPCIGMGGIDVINSYIGTDQRGVTRPASDNYDLGAFQSRGFSISASTGSGQSTGVNELFAEPLSVTVAANVPTEPVRGGVVTFTAPTTGASATVAAARASIGANGVATTTAIANDIAGPYTVTAVTSAGSMAFNLANTTFGPAPAPTISPNGGAFTSAKQVSLSDAVNGATIYYTTDGSVPTTASTVYTIPITTFTNETINAIAIGPGYTQSPVAAATFTFPPSFALIVANTKDSGEGSLRAAITYANTSPGSTITFYQGVTGTITLASPLPMITTAMTIHGPTALPIAIDGVRTYRIFDIEPGTSSNVAISNLTMQNGYAIGTAGNSGNGGAIFQSGGNVTVKACTFNGNQASGAGGAICLGAGFMAVTSCTMESNGAGDGATIIQVGGTLTVTACTIAYNYPGLGTNQYVVDGGTLVDDIVVNDGYQLVGNATATYSDIVLGSGVIYPGQGNIDANPLLFGEDYYGGQTGTMALLPGSPCLGAGTAVAGLTSDQRGVAIPQGGRYDMGAFESQGFAIKAAGAGGQSTSPGASFASPLTATVTANAALEPVAGGTVTFTGPTTGAGATITGSPATIAAGGAVSVTAKANTKSGTYNVVANTRAGSVAYSLTNQTLPVTHLIVTVAHPQLTGSPNSVTVAAADSFGNTVASYGGTVHFTSSDASATLPANSTLANGVGTFTVTMHAAGSQTLTATDTVTASITGTVTVTPPPKIDTRVLWTNTDGTASVWSAETNGQFQHADFGPYTGWTAIGLADDASDVALMLWDHASDHQASLFRLNASGAPTVTLLGPTAGWQAKAVAAAPNGHVRVLWNHTADNQVALWDIDETGAHTSTTYGPFAGWAANGVACGPDSEAYIAWNHAADKQFSLWKVASDGSYTSTVYGPFVDAGKHWQEQSMAVGPDGHVKLLWLRGDFAASLWDLNASTHAYTYFEYGPYTGNAALGVSVGLDDHAHLMWDTATGGLSLWDLPTISTFTHDQYGPYSGWTATAIANPI